MAKRNGLWALYAVFFFSGIPALIYQIVWQRALFGIYGVNVESVTMTVAAFMLGLGLGSLLGGRVSRWPNAPLVAILGSVELAIALFGLFSLQLFASVARLTPEAGPAQAGVITLLLLLIPTILMGSTLPIGVAYLVRISPHVGNAVGTLYFLNTLGSACACLLAVYVLMPGLGMLGSARSAAAMNVTVGVSALALYFSRAKLAPTYSIVEASAEAPSGLLSLPISLALVISAGFMSISYEVVWYRAYHFTTAGSSRIFGWVLAMILGGIAFGSLLGLRLCQTNSAQNRAVVLRRIAILFFAATLAGFINVPLLAAAVVHVSYFWILPFLCVAAGLIAATFPMVCHLSARPDANAGSRTSQLYMGNILGSTLGSVVTGYVLLDMWSLRAIHLFLAVAGIATMLALLWAVYNTFRLRIVTVMSAAACGAILVLSSGPLFSSLYERLQSKSEYNPNELFTDIVETRSGVVTVDDDKTVYGDGAYDGYLTTDITDSDSVLRPFSLSLIHAAPKTVLIIGASAGAWSEVVANHPQVERVTIVEINPGYVTVMARYSEVAPLLTNPKVEYFITDGRRWLISHPYQKFDIILMDTTYHWRAHAANLLSRDFLDMTRSHLNPGGILYYNTTHSGDAQLTGVTSFPYALRFGPFLAVSEGPITLDKCRWRETLISYRMEGVPVFNLNEPRHRERLEKILSYTDRMDSDGYDTRGFETAASILRRNRDKRIITDDNLACEWGR